ncbi:MAG: hypothetical protein WC966_02425 [Bradymonadales bacterium]
MFKDKLSSSSAKSKDSGKHLDLSFKIASFGVLFFLFFMLLACNRQQEDAVLDSAALLATVDGDEITVQDFELAHQFLPDFVRQMEVGSQIKLSQFGAMLQMVLLANEAEEQSLLSPAQRSIAVKEALAKHYASHEAAKLKIDLSEEAVSNFMLDNPEYFLPNERFLLVYALVHSAQRAQILRSAYLLALSAQWGRALGDSSAELAPAQPLHFEISFATRFSENKEFSVLLGPFSKTDAVSINCPDSIAVLQKAQSGELLYENIACSEHWHSFAVLGEKLHDPELTALESENLARQLIYERAVQQRTRELLAEER